MTIYHIFEKKIFSLCKKKKKKKKNAQNKTSDAFWKQRLQTVKFLRNYNSFNI